MPRARPGDDGEAGARQRVREEGGRFEAVGVGGARADDRDGGSIREPAATVEDGWRELQVTERARIVVVAGDDHAQAARRRVGEEAARELRRSRRELDRHAQRAWRDPHRLRPLPDRRRAGGPGVDRQPESTDCFPRQVLVSVERHQDRSADRGVHAALGRDRAPSTCGVLARVY